MTDEATTMSQQLDDLLRRVRQGVVEKCAAKVEAAGCSCSPGNQHNPGTGRYVRAYEDGRTFLRLEEHESPCPIAIAKYLRESCPDLASG